MVELSEAWGRVIGALVRGEVAWQGPEEIASAVGRSIEETMDELAEMDAAGWLEVWERESGPVVTLSALGAERLRVRLVETGADATPRWALAGDPDPPEPRARHVCSAAQAAALDFVVDPHPSADLEVEGLEQAALRARAASPRPDEKAVVLPRPTVLLGQRLSPWPGPRPAPAATCPVCGGEPIASNVYCLYCDRWGLDARLASTQAPLSHNRSNRPRVVAPPPNPVQAASTARNRRKARIRAKLTAQAQADRGRKRSQRAGSGTRQLVPSLV